jgi:hypothetical protein
MLNTSQCRRRISLKLAAVWVLPWFGGRHAGLPKASAAPVPGLDLGRDLTLGGKVPPVAFQIHARSVLQGSPHVREYYWIRLFVAPATYRVESHKHEAYPDSTGKVCDGR